MEPKTGQDELKANVALVSEVHRNGKEVVTDCFETLFTRLAMNEIVLMLSACTYHYLQFLFWNNLLDATYA